MYYFIWTETLRRKWNGNRNTEDNSIWNAMLNEEKVFIIFSGITFLSVRSNFPWIHYLFLYIYSYNSEMHYDDNVGFIQISRWDCYVLKFILKRISSEIGDEIGVVTQYWNDPISLNYMIRLMKLHLNAWLHFHKHLIINDFLMHFRILLNLKFIMLLVFEYIGFKLKLLMFVFLLSIIDKSDYSNNFINFSLSNFQILIKI